MFLQEFMPLEQYIDPDDDQWIFEATQNTFDQIFSVEIYTVLCIRVFVSCLRRHLSSQTSSAVVAYR
uniref:Mediator of RNA polymerase II transcription subunit 6 n=1 Tax=Syphacia muris TaxID=451379 RepID=A0A0N5AHJ8_9BILA